MYCSNCGTKIEGDSRFCSNCGHNIEKLNSNSYQDFQTNNQHSKKNPFELFKMVGNIFLITKG
ncbi:MULTISPECIES: zinc-ribbon domain-containing protein [Staphylococcus]|nr:zinc-ribbon domain-containing protein [Staphylococcus sp. HMSC62A08]